MEPQSIPSLQQIEYYEGKNHEYHKDFFNKGPKYKSARKKKPSGIIIQWLPVIGTQMTGHSALGVPARQTSWKKLAFDKSLDLEITIFMQAII